MKTIKKNNWYMLLFASLLLFFENIRMNMLNTLSVEIIKDFNINAFQFGKLSATFLLANVIFLLPAGFLLDRFSIRKLLSLGLFIGTIASFVLGFTHNFNIAQSFMFMAGIGCSFCFLGSTKLAFRWFDASWFAFITGLIIMIAMLGGLIGQLPIEMLKEMFGWRAVFLLLAISEILAMIVVWCYLEDFPKQKITTNIQTMKKGTITNLFIGLILNKQNWLSGLYTSILNLPITLLGAIWGVLYLAQSHHFSNRHASLIVSMLFIGIMLGSPIIGKFSDKIKSRRLPMIIAALSSIAIILIVMLTNFHSIYIYLLLFFGLGFFSGTQCVGYAVVAEINTKDNTSLAMSLATILVMGGGMLFQPFFGWILASFWDGETMNSVPLYSPQNYFYAMLILPASYVLSLIFVLFIKESYQSH